MNRDYSLVVLVCGTVGSAVAIRLASSKAGRPSAVRLVDKGLVRPENAITCPAYGGRAGAGKADVLAEVLAARFPRLDAAAFPGPVEDADWDVLLADGSGPTVVLLALDDWAARLAAVEDLRRRALGGRDPEVLIVQGAVDRGLGQVSVFSTSYESPCPACGLDVLPEKTPCVAFTEAGTLVRGDLREEAAAVAGLVDEIVQDCLRTGTTKGLAWLDSKTVIRTGPGSPTVRRTWPRRRRIGGCMGPHTPGGPVRLAAERRSGDEDFD